MIRAFLAALAALTVVVPSAMAQEVTPLAGTGENLQPIARVKVDSPTEIELAGDWAFLATDATDDHQGGLTIVNVADPTKPYVQARWYGEQDGLEDVSFGDVDLSPDGNLAFLTNAHCSDCTEGEAAWVAIVDVSDKSRPKLVGKVIDDDTIDYVHSATLDNKTLYLNPQVAAFYPQPGNAHITVFDVSDPTKPVKKGIIAPPGSDAGLAHDTYVDHRPDGKTLLYGASIHKSDVIDITDPMAPTWLQTATSPSYTISHDVQPNFDRSIIVVDDEGAAGGQLDEAVSACGKVGAGGLSLDSGSVHFFQAAPDGTFANGGVVHLGSFNAPANANTGACVAHVFWQAPDENRMTQAYYRTGVYVIDFSDPANPTALGSFKPDGDGEGGEYWSFKPHRGYVFASNMLGSMDILRYTGEGGKRWPATAGPAEVQRAARQGVKYEPVAGAGTAPLPGAGSQQGTGRDVGRFALTLKTKKKVAGKKGKKTKLVLTFKDAAGKVVGKAKVKKAARRKATVKVSGVAVAGTYRYVLKGKGRKLKSGSFTVTKVDGMSLTPSRTLIAKAR